MKKNSYSLFYHFSLLRVSANEIHTTKFPFSQHDATVVKWYRVRLPLSWYDKKHEFEPYTLLLFFCC